MKVEFASDDLDRLETDSGFDAGYPPDVVRAFRRRLQFIRAAKEEQDLRSWRSNQFMRLGGDRSHQHSIRLGTQWRLVVELRHEPSSIVIVVVSVEDHPQEGSDR